MRTVPRTLLYLLFEATAEMRGDPIEAANSKLRFIFDSLLDDPAAFEWTSLSVITFGESACQVVPLTGVHEFHQHEPLRLEADGTAPFSSALRLLLECLDREVRTETSDSAWADFRPRIVIFLHQPPDRAWLTYADELKRRKLPIMVVMADEVTETAPLKRMTNWVLHLGEANAGALFEIIKFSPDDTEWEWSLISRWAPPELGESAAGLPPPPGAIQLPHRVPLEPDEK